MSLFQFLLLVFIAVPILEIYVLLEVGSVIGPYATVGLVVLTAVAGAALIRAQGFSTIARVQASLDRGEIPAVEIVEGAVLLVAGALLLTPGFVTDSFGFACLATPLRRAAIRRFLATRIVPPEGAARRPPPGPHPPGRSGSRVIEGEYRREDD